MNSIMVHAFADELEKIAAFRVPPGMAQAAGKAVKSVGSAVSKFTSGVAKNVGGTAKAFKTPIESTKRGWHGIGPEGTPVPGAGWMGSGEAFKASKHLPVGAKSLTVAGGVLGAPDAFAKEDLTGRGRGRIERTARWMGGNVGGVIGSPFGMSGAIAGGLAGEAIGGAPSGVMRRLRHKQVTTGESTSPRFTPGAPVGTGTK